MRELLPYFNENGYEVPRPNKGRRGEIASITTATTKILKGNSRKGFVSSARFNAWCICEPSYLSGSELPSSKQSRLTRGIHPVTNLGTRIPRNDS